MKKVLSAILFSVLIFSLTACVNKESNTVKEVTKEEVKVGGNIETTKPEVEVEKVETRDVVLYFSDDQAMYLVGMKRAIEKPTAKSIVAELLKGPGAGTEKLVATLPEGVEVLDVTVKENIAYVDFEGNVSEKIAGSTGEGMALYSIINTLVLDTELGITGVQFLIEGKNVDSIAGHYDVSKPMIEDKEKIQK